MQFWSGARLKLDSAEGFGRQKHGYIVTQNIYCRYWTMSHYLVKFLFDIYML